MRTDHPYGAAAMIADRRYQAALAWANERRAAEGHQPLTFLPRAQGCQGVLELALPGAIAIDTKVAWTAARRGHERHELPRAVTAFQDALAAGEFPHLLRLPGVSCDAESHRVACPQGAWQTLRRSVPSERVA